MEQGEYLRAIEGRFLALKGRGFSLSAKDTGMVLKWHKEGLPLRRVLAALEELALRLKRELKPRPLTLTGVDFLLKKEESLARRKAPSKPLLPPSGEAEDYALLYSALAKGAFAKEARLLLEDLEKEGLHSMEAAEKVDEFLFQLMEKALGEDEKHLLEESLGRYALTGDQVFQEERRRFLFRKLLAEHYQMTELVTVLLGGS